MGRHAEAEPLYLQAMEIRRTALGEQHPDYATSLNNLAALYVAMGRHAEAEPLYLNGDGDSPRGPGRAASRLRRLAEQPGGAVRRDGPSRGGRAALRASQWRFVASPWASSIPTTPPR